MGLLEAIVLGIVQGLTEFLPISSSGHLLIVPAFFGWEDAGSGFTAVIQLGTLLAILIYFREDIGRTFKGWSAGFRDAEKRGTMDWNLGWGVVIGTIPIAVAGLLLEKRIDSDFRSPMIVAGALLLFGLLMGFADSKGGKTRELKNIRVKDCVIMGLWQCLALVPGSSRSGSTITGGLFGGFDRETAARVSFLLSIPSIALSGLYKLFKERDNLMHEGAIPTVVATVVAFAVGWLAISWLMKLLKTKSLWPFAIYRCVLAGVVVLMFIQGLFKG
ncbi:MAG: undecaprenyl-diphosphate phosphatase [Fimbriimonadaceae bacterium]